MAMEGGRNVCTIFSTSEYLGEAVEFVVHDKATSFRRVLVCDELLVRLRLANFVKDSICEMPRLFHKKISALE